MTSIEKAFICTAKYTSEIAADNARDLLDSKYVAENLTEAELANLEKCVIFLTRIAKRFDDQYNRNEAWKR
jgi:hypothetical protein